MRSELSGERLPSYLEPAVMVLTLQLASESGVFSVSAGCTTFPPESLCMV